MGLRKKAMYFTMDAFLAAMLILGGFVLINRMTVTEEPITHIDFMAKDLLTALDQIPITSINHPFVYQELQNGTMRASNTALEQIATYWALNQTDKAKTLTSIILNQSLPESLGVRLQMEPNILFEQPITQTGGLAAARRMISGVDKDKPIVGSSSYGYLRTIKDKRSSSYGYFGGFAGQGNITLQLEPLPDDVNSSRIKSIKLEGDFKRNFTVKINNLTCGNYQPSQGNFTADIWDLSHCNSSITSGINYVNILFDSLNNAYVGGGFVRVDYETDTFFTDSNYSLTTYKFPEILGIINLFDSFYVPGNLKTMEIYLHYHANHTNSSNNPFYLTIGNEVIYNDLNSTDPVIVTLSDIYLSALLNYSQFSNSTVPIRLGFENLTYHTEYIGSADVVLITDVSGSMDWNFTHDNSWGATRRNCDNSLINDLSTQRLSVAKCLDKDFATSILNVTGNTMGLVSYESSTDSTLGLTTNIAAIYNEIGMGTGTPTGYVASGSTCICCGINSAASTLSNGLQLTTLISSQDIWNYTNNSMVGNIPVDSQNRTWYDPDYSLESTWYTGPAVLGHDAGGGGVTIDTEIGSNLLGTQNIVDLWELTSDTGSPEVDFTSGLNSTANTYGIGSSNDGWDWSSGVFDYGGSFNLFIVWNQRLLMRTPNSGSNDVSGAFAVSINITQEQYDIITSNGSATISFNYWWDDYRNYFENNDQVWLKARFTSPFSGSHMLGSNLDSTHSHGDASYEIDTSDNPNIDIVNEFFSQEIGSWIEGPGTYYLELGGKLDRSYSNEWGYFSYDNILFVVKNNTDNYYFRKHFTINDINNVRRGFFNLLEDDSAAVYLNGNLLLNDQQERNGTYWDRSGIRVKGSYFRVGDNVLAVHITNSNTDSKFDLELIGVNDSQQKSMMVMTDGEANVECGQQGWTPDLDGDGNSDTASDDAIQAACDASENYGMIVYAVGFSNTADEPTLSGIANCGNGLYRKSINTSELQVFYQDVVLNILEVSRQSQSILISSGTPTNSELYGDSYVRLSHDSSVVPPEQNEIELVFQTEQFNSCDTNITIQQGLRVTDAKVTSYSGEHWTSLVTVDSNTVFNLSDYNSNYSSLGDPYIVHVPVKYLTPGLHNISMYTGDNDQNTTGCSMNNSLIYTAFINSSTSRSSVVELAVGCSWTIEFEDNSNHTFLVPQSYSGTKNCYYMNSSINYDSRDAYDVAVYSLLDQLDFDNDGRVLVNLEAEDLEIIVSLVNEVPYLWGPALMEVELWQ